MNIKNVKENYHWIENTENFDVLFHIGSSTIYQLTDNKLSQKMKNCFESNILDQEVLKTLETIDQEKGDSFSCSNCIKSVPTESKDFSISKLALVLTSDCNLRCEYCYANYGMYDYDAKTSFNNEKLTEGLTYLVSNFKEIQVIQFFGGEPSLCVNQINHVVTFFNNKMKNGEIEKMPTFGIVTNGVLMNNKLLALYTQYNFSITISIDGPKEINDALRYDRKGNGTFEIIRKNYLKLKEAKIKNIGFECTYTNEHLVRNISLVDLVDFFYEEFDSQVVHIVPVNIGIDSKLNVMKSIEKYKHYLTELVENTFKKIIEGKSVSTTTIVLGTIIRVFYQISEPRICPAGVKTFSLSHDNQISPCFMYTSNEETSYGKVGDDPNDILKNAIDFDEKINSKIISEECKICPARVICSSCLGGFEIEDSGLTLTNPIFCETIKHTMNQVIKEISKLKTQEDQWEKFSIQLKGVV